MINVFIYNQKCLYNQIKKIKPTERPFSFAYVSAWMWIVFMFGNRIHLSFKKKNHNFVII